MDYTIYPLEGIGPINFGMTRQQVRKVLGEPEKTSLKEGTPEFPSDYYIALGFFVFYDDQTGLCKAMQLFSPSTPTLDGRQLIPNTIKDVVTFFQSIGSDVHSDNVGITFLKFGISLYSEYCDGVLDSDYDVEAVTVGASGYFD